jgi:hypothetical protein
MSTRRNIAILGLSVVSLVSVPERQNRHAASFFSEPTLLLKATHNGWVDRKGDAPFEAGFSIDQDGHPGRARVGALMVVYV